MLTDSRTLFLCASTDQSECSIFGAMRLMFIQEPAEVLLKRLLLVV